MLKHVLFFPESLEEKLCETDAGWQMGKLRLREVAGFVLSEAEAKLVAHTLLWNSWQSVERAWSWAPPALRGHTPAWVSLSLSRGQAVLFPSGQKDRPQHMVSTQHRVTSHRAPKRGLLSDTD